MLSCTLFFLHIVISSAVGVFSFALSGREPDLSNSGEMLWT